WPASPSRAGFLAGPLGDGIAGALPGGEPAVHLDDRTQTHLLGDVGGQRGAPGAVAVEDELLAGGEDVLVVGAVGIDPELQHAARTVKGAGDHAFALELPHVTQVDEHRVALRVTRACLVEPDRCDT